MAERRYGFRFSFAEGCIIVVSMVGASFLVFLFGVYAGRELEARKASEHTSTVRLAAVPEGVTSSVGKDGQGKVPASAMPSPAIDKTKTVVIVSPPRPSGAGATPPVSQEKTLGANPEEGLKPPSSVVEGQPAKSTSLVSPAVAPGTHLSPAEKNLTPTPNPSLSQMGRSSLTNPNTIIPSVAAPPRAEKSTQAMQVIQSVKKESKLSTPIKPFAATQGSWSVQIQATRDHEGAQQMVRDLQSQGYAPTISRVMRDGEVWYRVRVGSFANVDEAQASVEHLRREGRFPRAYLVAN